MAFPQTPLDLTVELYLSGAWTDVTSLFYGRDPLTITRGRSSEGGEVDRSLCKGTANNRDGNLSPRNPTGTWYGQLGRNTPMRVRKEPASDGYLLSSAESDGAETPDSANLSITGDIDVRVEVAFDDWDTFGGLANKFSGSSQRSWAFYKNADGTLTFGWSTTGADLITKTSTAAVVVPASGRLALRATLDVNNGAAGNDVRFYTASSIGGSYSQLGSTVTTAGVTSIFDSTAAVQAGRSNIGVGLVGRVYAFECYQGIAGTLRADLLLDEEEAGSGSFTDGLGLTWSMVDDATVVDPRIRFRGEVSEWPPRWDVTGTDVYVPLEASGVLRRLGQGGQPALRSTLYRGLTTLANPPKAYWPCEDGEDATELGSAVGGPPMTVIGEPSLQSHTGFKCSAPLPTLNDSEWSGAVPVYTGTGSVQVWFLLQIPTGGSTAGQSLCLISTTGSVRTWNLTYQGNGGDLVLRASTADGTTVLAPADINFNLDGKLLRVGVQLEQNGADIDWSIDTLEVGVGNPAVGSGGTLAGHTISRATKVKINSGGGHTDVAIGHVAVHDEILDLFDLADELNAYVGEAAGRRIQRLCEQEAVAFRAVGDLDATAAMGPQLPTGLVDLLREAALADGGILYEPRDLYGLAYRTRESMYNQPAALELDYAAKHLGSGGDQSGIEPVDDDQLLRNDITVRRADGASYRAVLETGPLSILPPPDGVGRYDEEVTLNLESDPQLPDQAGWRLFLGTVDEARYPVLEVNLARSPFVADATLQRAAEDLDIGGRLTVSNPPAWLPPGDISQLAEGFKETMVQFEHQVGVNCTPESPWGRVAVYDAAADRYSSDGTTTAEALDTTETSIDVSTPSGPVWSFADGAFDIVIGGEQISVGGVSGAGASQTFTGCTRSVNGVVKSHSSGVAVELARPVVYAI